MDTRLQPSTSVAGLLATATNLYIGGQITGGGNFSGYISDLRIYTNCCSTGFQQSLVSYLCAEARIPVNSIYFIGDSIQEGLHTTAALGGLQQILSPVFLNFRLDTEAFSGRTSAEEVTSVGQWASFKSTGINAACLNVGYNDFNGVYGLNCSNQVPLTLTNLFSIIAILKSNSIPAIVATLISGLNETNGLAIGYDWRSNLNNGIRGLTNFGALVADYAAYPSLGTNYACLNTVLWNTDNVHPTAAGYTNMANILEPILYAQLYHNGILGSSTNGFSLSGHIFNLSNGIVTFLQ